MCSCGWTKKMPTQLSRNVRKRTLVHGRPAKVQISLCIRTVWSEASLGAVWADKDAKFLHPDNENSGQTARSSRLIQAVDAYIMARLHGRPVKIQISLLIRGLIRIFPGRNLDSQACKGFSCGQRKLWSDCAMFVRFLTIRLNCFFRSLQFRSDALCIHCICSERCESVPSTDAPETIYSRLSLSRITAYLEVKLWSRCLAWKSNNRWQNLLWKRAPLFHNIF